MEKRRRNNQEKPTIATSASADAAINCQRMGDSPMTSRYSHGRTIRTRLTVHGLVRNQNRRARASSKFAQTTTAPRASGTASVIRRGIRPGLESAPTTTAKTAITLRAAPPLPQSRLATAPRSVPAPIMIGNARSPALQ